ncbi:unnamed protein product [Candidula unifasciata]|uniref:Uncharacterized protein n=1 Tax=Candidula unifasciata TaxID=100452 RepID=A0A8S3YRC9_9EUPU|nr:unnamed protein product [Candidula unifasciata]
MQIQLTRQFKADKKAEITKITKQEQERLDREEEIRTLALEMRRREREKRHREREEEEKERRQRRKSRRSDKGSQSGSDDDSVASSHVSRSVSTEGSPGSDNSPEKEKEVDRVKVDRKPVDKPTDSGKEERRRGPPPATHSPDERRKSDERRWEGRSDRSRWNEDEDRDKVRGSRGGRWDGPSRPPSSRWSDRNWGAESSRFERRHEDWNDEHRPRRPPPGAYRSRGVRPVVPRSRSPLMARPRVPSDPRLLEEPLDFD